MFYQQKENNRYHVQQEGNLVRDYQKVVWVEAAILVCNAWVVFGEDYHQEMRQWAESVLQQGKPGWKLVPEAIVEVVVGYPLHKRQTRANMYEWLQFVLQRAGCNLQRYQYQFAPVEMESSMTQVWCLTAVSPLKLTTD